jgi:hypothetical protein
VHDIVGINIGMLSGMATILGNGDPVPNMVGAIVLCADHSCDQIR